MSWQIAFIKQLFPRFHEFFRTRVELKSIEIIRNGNIPGCLSFVIGRRKFSFQSQNYPQEFLLESTVTTLPDSTKKLIICFQAHFVLKK
jgi:hypothetical protein